MPEREGALAVPLRTAYLIGDPPPGARNARNSCTEGDLDVVYDHATRAVREDDHDAFELMTSGTLYSDLPETVKRYRDDIFDDKYNRLDWSGLSRSITAHIARDGYWYIHPEQHRTFDRLGSGPYPDPSRLVPFCRVLLAPVSSDRKCGAPCSRRTCGIGDSQLFE